MPGTPRPDPVSTKRQRIAELARNCPDMAFTNLAHHIDIEWPHTVRPIADSEPFSIVRRVPPEPSPPLVSSQLDVRKAV